ncbi:MAG: methylated-DNA--[protein]-cysteine S-methyltransferase, partial [Stenotrophomonas sp.]
MNTLYYDRFDSPIGALTVAVDQVGVRHILFAENRHDAKGREHWQRDPDAVAEPRRQLLEYLRGQRQHFALTLAPVGTAFQLQVWHTLAQIPFGAT